jgi:hypothetical protein
MSSLIPIDDDDLLKEVLSAPTSSRKPREPKPESGAVRDYNTWFKLRHKFIQELVGLPAELSLARCSNPVCPHADKPKGAIAEVNGKDMCRDCFLGGYNA